MAASVGASNTVRSGSSTPKCVTHARGELGGEQRVAAELEEVVMRADLAQAQHLAPDRGEPLLGRRSRRHRRGAAVGPVIARLGQGAAVDLAVAR